MERINRRKICKGCNKEFALKYDSNFAQKFCNQNCYYKWMKENPSVKEVKKKCPECKIIFIAKGWYQVGRKYCSKECWYKDEARKRKGKKNPAFKHGSAWDATTYFKEIRERDGELCLLCGIPKGYFAQIHIHHIIPRGGGNGDHRPQNLISVCAVCHSYIHQSIKTFIPILQKFMSKKYGYNYSKEKIQYVIKPEHLNRLDEFLRQFRFYRTAALLKDMLN